MHKLRLQFRVGGCRAWGGCVVDPQVVIIRLSQHSLAGVGTGAELGNTYSMGGKKLLNRKPAISKIKLMK